MAGVGSLEEEALKRKERLQNLRNKQNKNDTSSDVKEQENVGKTKLPKPVFRSYKPIDDTLKDNTLPKIKPTDVTDKIKGHIEASKTEVIEEVDLVTLAPRKPDWDLKRDVAKKLEKLDRRTQRAIAELLRERLKKSSEDLAQIVNATAVSQSTTNVDDNED